jgi:F-type H+-transporting ATPase subunit a
MSGLSMAALTPTVDVQIGDHITRKVPFLGVINVDTLYATLIAATLVLAFGLLVARRSTSGVPSKAQLVWETVVGAVQRQVDDSIGPTAPFVVPLAVCLFMFILFANWLELIPTGHHPEYLKPPTADVNFTFALALSVLFWAWGVGIRRKGLRRWLGGFLRPYKALLPINIIEQVTKPLSLSLRLFGNIFAGGIMLAVLALLPGPALAPLNIIWKAFDVIFIGAIQAFIFALLTILYFAFELGEGH